ncbi:MAG: hypothetical protein ACI4VQ_07100 [Clostridia bacterium]
MIIDGFLYILQGIVNVLLAPLTPINWAVTTGVSIGVIADFINVVAFVLPWKNIQPIFTFIVAMFAFRAIVSLIKTIWDLLPIL